jgi:hypothetical protein
MHLFLSPRHQSTRQKARGERVGDKFYLSRWLDDVVYNNYIGYMAVEAQALKDQSMKRQNICPKQILFSAFTKVKGICGGL